MYLFNKKLILISAVISFILIIILGFFLYYGYAQDKKITNAIKNAQREEVEKIRKIMENYELSNQASQAKKLEKCDEIKENDPARDNCINRVAISSQREEYCGSINGDKAKQACFGYFNYLKAIKSGDI